MDNCAWIALRKAWIRPSWAWPTTAQSRDCARMMRGRGRCLRGTGPRSEGWDRINELQAHTSRRPEERRRRYT